MTISLLHLTRNSSKSSDCYNYGINKYGAEIKFSAPLLYFVNWLALYISVSTAFSPLFLMIAFIPSSYAGGRESRLWQSEPIKWICPVSSSLNSFFFRECLPVTNDEILTCTRQPISMYSSSLYVSSISALYRSMWASTGFSP